MTGITLRARNTPADTPAATTSGGLPDKLRMANALASAGPAMLPASYVNNPGGCLLAIDWAERYDVALFEVLAEVSFNRGRPTVGARLQRKMASRQGYLTRKVDGDDKSCTVAVIGPDGKEVGRAAYSFATAQALGIIYQKDGRTLKPTWAGDPAQMLYHRATTRALDHYGPSEYSALFSDGDITDVDTDVDVVDVINAQPADVAEVDQDDDVADDQPGTEITVESMSVDDIKTHLKTVGVTQREAIEAAREMGHEVWSLAAITDNPGALADVIDWSNQEDKK